MEFYKINNPKTSEFIDAINNMEYFTMKQLETKKKQLFTYFKNEFNSDVLIGFTNITNSGGYPIIFGSNCSFNEVLEEFYKDSEEEVTEEDVELFAYSVRLL